jgi:hypothetical protein
MTAAADVAATEYVVEDSATSARAVLEDALLRVPAGELVDAVLLPESLHAVNVANTTHSAARLRVVFRILIPVVQ